MKTTMRQRQWMAQQVWRRLSLSWQQKLSPYRALFQLGVQDDWMRKKGEAYSETALQQAYHDTRDLRVLAYAAGALAKQHSEQMRLRVQGAAEEDAWAWVDVLDEETLDALSGLLHTSAINSKRTCKRLKRAGERSKKQALPCWPVQHQRWALNTIACQVERFLMRAAEPSWWEKERKRPQISA